MKINVRVKPNVRECKIEKISDIEYKVSVKEPAKQGKANFAVIEVLAEYFKVGISHVRIVSGLKSKQKIVEIT